jgi:hypothetical protein
MIYDLMTWKSTGVISKVNNLNDNISSKTVQYRKIPDKNSGINCLTCCHGNPCILSDTSTHKTVHL